MEPSTLCSTISTSSGLNLFNSVRYSTSPPATLIDGFDALLHGSSTPLRRGDVTEVQGVTASGKTQLLLKLAVNHLLPRSIHVRIDRQVLLVPVGGKEELVTWFNCTASIGFSKEIEKLSEVLRFHLVQAINQYRRPKGIGSPTEEEVDSLVQECLARLQVFSPTSTLQLACTIRNLPDWYTKNAQGGGADEELGCVIIDGMTEFAWTDEFERLESQSQPSPLVAPLKLFSSAISHLRQSLSPLIFISQWVLRPLQPHSVPSQQNLPFYRPHYNPPHYPALTKPPLISDDQDPLSPYYYPSSSSSLDSPLFPIHYHITLHPSPRPIFRKGVSLAMVLKEGTRQEQERTRQGTGSNRGGGGGEETRERWTEGIVCVLREKGGKELGSWEMEIGENEIIA
ncbi:hypothetical protein JCM5350_007576 [Sporobolomyces pararoseus]